MICLIRPPCVESFRFSTTTATMPLGLAYVAGSLEAAGNKVHIVDAVAEAPRKHTRYIRGFLVGLGLKEIVQRIPEDSTLVGITVIFTHEWPAVVQLIRLIKAKRPDLPVILGGEHVTAMPEFCLATSGADYLVLGEGEEIIVGLVEAVEKGTDPSGLDCIAYRKGDEIFVNKRRGRKRKIDDIPLPAWHLFDVKTYDENGFVGGMELGTISMPLLATRGCPYQCTFCAAPNMWTPSWFARDPIKVVDEIQLYMETYGAQDFCFQDLTAFTRKDWIVAFCNEILARNLNITWQLPTGTRSEAIDAEAAELLYRTGMKNMNYAPESGSETTRRLIKKKMKTENLMDSIKAALDARLNVGIFTLLGLPHDERAHLAENLGFLKRIGKMGVTDISVSYYMALPGTELFNSLYGAGKVKLDREYFIHILHASALLPSKNFTEHLGTLELIYWKFRFFFTFYSSKGFFRSVFRGMKGIFSKSHETRLAAAVHYAVISGLQAAKVQVGKPWISRSEEKAMFAGWDDTYRKIRGQNLASGVQVEAPADTTELHKSNVIDAIKRDHGTPHRVHLGDVLSPAS